MANRDDDDNKTSGVAANEVLCERRRDEVCKFCDDGSRGSWALCRDREEVISNDVYGIGEDRAYDLGCYCWVDMGILVVRVFAPKACNSLYTAIIVASDTSRAAELALFIGDMPWTSLLVSDWLSDNCCCCLCCCCCCCLLWRNAASVYPPCQRWLVIRPTRSIEVIAPAGNVTCIRANSYDECESTYCKMALPWRNFAFCKSYNRMCWNDKYKIFLRSCNAFMCYCAVYTTVSFIALKRLTSCWKFESSVFNLNRMLGSIAPYPYRPMALVLALPLLAPIPVLDVDVHVSRASRTYVMSDRELRICWLILSMVCRNVVRAGLSRSCNYISLLTLSYASLQLVYRSVFSWWKRSAIWSYNALVCNCNAVFCIYRVYTALPWSTAIWPKLCNICCKLAFSLYEILSCCFTSAS